MQSACDSLQSAQSASPTARSYCLPRHRETESRKVRRQSVKQRSQRAQLHPRSYAELTGSLYR